MHRNRKNYLLETIIEQSESLDLQCSLDRRRERHRKIGMQLQSSESNREGLEKESLSLDLINSGSDDEEVEVRISAAERKIENCQFATEKRQFGYFENDEIAVPVESDDYEEQLKIMQFSQIGNPIHFQGQQNTGKKKHGILGHPEDNNSIPYQRIGAFAIQQMDLLNQDNMAMLSPNLENMQINQTPLFTIRDEPALGSSDEEDWLSQLKSDDIDQFDRIQGKRKSADPKYKKKQQYFGLNSGVIVDLDEEGQDEHHSSDESEDFCSQVVKYEAHNEFWQQDLGSYMIDDLDEEGKDQEDQHIEQVIQSSLARRSSSKNLRNQEDKPYFLVMDVVPEISSSQEESGELKCKTNRGKKIDRQRYEVILENLESSHSSIDMQENNDNSQNLECERAEGENQCSQHFLTIQPNQFRSVGRSKSHGLYNVLQSKIILGTNKLTKQRSDESRLLRQIVDDNASDDLDLEDIQSQPKEQPKKLKISKNDGLGLNARESLAIPMFEYLNHSDDDDFGAKQPWESNEKVDYLSFRESTPCEAQKEQSNEYQKNESGRQQFMQLPKLKSIIQKKTPRDSPESGAKVDTLLLDIGSSPSQHQEIASTIYCKQKVGYQVPSLSKLPDGKSTSINTPLMHVAGCHSANVLPADQEMRSFGYFMGDAEGCDETQLILIKRKSEGAPYFTRMDVDSHRFQGLSSCGESADFAIDDEDLECE
ncbi:hypothetical protein FGO68_gene14208 [Halteria grandinella]|uniref:Uncharacterized protein n=1 Tax=Halteria grandinella TaxID=5974 RepID=A0A8J8NZV4_HALGN|nr:hypothetical protein FGO68_gene14208 [Halteria grandinella]